MKRLLVRSLALGGRVLRHTPLARSRLLNRLQADLAVRLHGSNEARMGPFRVRFHPRERVLSKRLLLYGGQEAPEVALLCSLVRPGDHALDVGANVGIYTLHLSRAVGPGGRVVAVEPDPESLALLRWNVEANGCSNVTVVPAAFGAESGTATLHRVAGHAGRSSLAAVPEASDAVEIAVRRGAEVLAGLGVAPRVAKIDVEGAEPLVVAGLGCRPEVLLFECVPRQMREMGEDPEAFLAGLAAGGYRLELVDPENGERRAGSPAEIAARAATARRVHNVLATRG